MKPEALLLTDEAFERFGEIAEVPASAQIKFRHELEAVFREAEAWHQFHLGAPRRKEVADKIAAIEKAAAKLLELTSDTTVRKELGFSVVRQERFGLAKTESEHDHQFNDMRLLVGRHVALANLEMHEAGIRAIQAGAGSYMFPVGSGRPGTLPQLVSSSGTMPYVANLNRMTAADFFITGSLGAAAASGCSLTLDKNSKRGTLIAFLDAARPYLSCGLLPKGLKMSRLQHLLTESRRWTKT